MKDLGSPSRPSAAGCLAAGLLMAGATDGALAQPAGNRFGAARGDTELLKRYDRNGDRILDAAERAAAMREFGFDTAVSPAIRRAAAPKFRSYTSEALYDPYTVRTIYLNFDTSNWETELAVFKNSDVEVPATVIVDGKVYKDVGVSFRGQSSFMRVGAGQKRSINLDINLVHKEQSLLGGNHLTLLNSANDPTFLRSLLYMQIARAYLPAPKVNYVRVVINNDNWGIYVNQQPVDKVFAQTAGGSGGPLWRVPGTPNGRGGLEYWGDNPSSYQGTYELKNRGAARTDSEAWAGLINLCRVLNMTPTDKLQAALMPILDIDSTLRFLAIDNALLNSDAYYTRASDYNMYVDNTGRFRFAPHDANESLQQMERRGGRQRSESQAATRFSAVGLDPLEGMHDPTKPLLSKLLALPDLRARYLGYVRDIASQWMDWSRIEPLAQKYQALVSDDIAQDQRKLSSTAAFTSGVVGEADGGWNRKISLKDFFEQRRAFLLETIPAR